MNHSMRSAVVLVLLLGTLALAVPTVSNTVDAWLFATDGETAPPKWNSQRPATVPPTRDAVSPGHPQLLPPGEHEPRPSRGKSPFAFDFEDEAPPHLQNRPGEVRPINHEEEYLPPVRPVAEASVLTLLQRELQALGAIYLAVDQLDRGQFEGRAIFPLSPQSTYQKVFSAVGTSPEAALEQILADVAAWQQVGSMTARP